MRDSTRQRWLELCATAAVTEDPKRLDELTAAILKLLKDEKELLLNGKNSAHRAAP